MAKHFGRTAGSGRNFIGTHKAVKLGVGKHNGLKTNNSQAAPPSSAFERKDLNDAAKARL